MTTTGANPPQTPAEAARRATASIGVAVALGAVSMTFATLLLAYAIVRAQAPSWPPPGEGPRPGPWPWALLATAAALAGSAAISAARRIGSSPSSPSSPSSSARRAALLAATAAGVVFIALQAASWTRLAASGLRPSSGLLGSVVFALTIFHALHAGAAVSLLLPLAARAARGRSVSTPAVAARASFVHLVTAAWLVIFLAVFVL